MNYKEFVSNYKSMLIAPAGHGKTHLITECLNHTEGKQLILTHTHAGVASILEKIKKSKQPSHKFHVETITGYAQKYLLAYYTNKDIPSREDETYYSFVIEKASVIISSPIVAKMIQATYGGLFVDEYQDCTLQQHQFIISLSQNLSTRVLGDPLQGIFSFKGHIPMVDLNDIGHMGDFHQNKYRLEEPWRWKGINEPLGKELKDIRVEIESQKSFDVKNYKYIEFIKITSPEDLYNPSKQYYKDLNNLLKEKNLLIIHPESSSINIRKKVVKGFKTPISLLESIDDKDFYNLAKKFDSLNEESFPKIIYDVSIKLFNKTELEKWINAKGCVKKKDENLKPIADLLAQKYAAAKAQKTFMSYAEILRFVYTIKEIRCYRKELYNSLCRALDEATYNNKSVHESMVDKRNHIRRVGRKIYGRCIGTTLLTKGLEFETVVILDAHKFQCPKNLYVAFTRASKRLVVFSTSSILLQ